MRIVCVLRHGSCCISVLFCVLFLYGLTDWQIAQQALSKLWSYTCPETEGRKTTALAFNCAQEVYKFLRFLLFLLMFLFVDYPRNWLQ